MNLGAENKRNVIALGVLALIAAYAVWSNFLSGPPSSPSVSAPSSSAENLARQRPGEPSAPAGLVRRAARQVSEDWHPVLRTKRPEDQIDPGSVDPTLKLASLAKLQEVPPAGSGRNLFSMSQAPAPELPKGPEPKVQVKATMGPPPIPPPAPPPGPPPPPPMPPITFKYYGIATVRSDGSQTAFFLDGDNIIIKSVGETVEGSYKLVRIGSNSAVVEDTKSKRQQTVPLAEEAQG
jgi:hypothetical protein